MTKCKSCGTHILWKKTATGKNIPVDLFNESGAQIDESIETFDPKKMVSHFASCKDAKLWRKKKLKKEVINGKKIC